MKSLFFSIADQIFLEVVSNTDFTFSDSEYLLLRGYIPGIVRLDSRPDHIDSIIEHTESSDIQLIQAENHIHIFDTWNGIFPPDLYHVIYGIVRRYLLNKNLFSVHGACVGNGEHVLIVGHSGSGKTSVVRKLMHDDRMKIFSGNKTVVSFAPNKRLMACAGTPTITIKESDAAALTDTQKRDHIDYWDRSAFMLDVEKYTVGSVPIKAIVVVRLNDYIEEHKKMNPLSALHTLYPYFLDVVNADVVMSSINDVIVGTPPPGIEKYLVSHLQETLKTLPVYSLIGSSSFVANAILAL